MFFIQNSKTCHSDGLLLLKIDIFLRISYIYVCVWENLFYIIIIISDHFRAIKARQNWRKFAVLRTRQILLIFDSLNWPNWQTNEKLWMHEFLSNEFFRCCYYNVCCNILGNSRNLNIPYLHLKLLVRL